MTRFRPTPALTVLALILAATPPATAQDRSESYIPQEPPVPLHELIPSEADEEAAAEISAEQIGTAVADGDFTDPPVIALPDLDLLPIGPAQGGAVALDPDAPEAVIPEGWQVHTHFGLSFALPADFTLEDLQNDASDDEGLMLAYTRIDRATFTGQALSIALLPDAMLEGFWEGMMEEFGIAAPETWDEPVQIAGMPFVEHGATGQVEGGMMVHVRALMGEMRLQNGLGPVILIARSNMDPEVAETVEAGFLASFSIPDPALLGLPDPEPFRDGLMTYRILPSWRSSGGISPDFEQIRLSGGYGTPTQARIEFGDVGSEDWAMRNFIEYEFRTGPDAISEGMLDGVPVWILEGQPAFTLSGAQRTTEGDAWRRYSMVTQVCLPERGPLAATLITTEDRMTSDLAPDAVLGGVRLHLTPDATPCPDSVTDAVLNAMLALGMPVAVAPGQPDTTLQPSDGPAAVPPPVALVPDPQPPLPQQPPEGDPGVGKPTDDASAAPDQTLDPEAQAWALRSDQPSVDATYGYLQDWPEGRHASEARAWLIERGIVPPGMASAVLGNGTAAGAQTDDEIAFSHARRQDTAAAYWTYLKAFPQGAFAGLARASLARLLTPAR